MHKDVVGLSRRRVRRAGRVLLLATLAAAGLVGCARFESRPLSASKAVGDFEARSLADAGLRSFLESNHLAGPWPRATWDFNALSLVAFYFHPDLDVARAQLAGAKAAGVAAGVRPNPTVGFTPTYDTTTTPPWILGVSFDIPVETMGKRGYRLGQAAHLSEAARFNLTSTAWQVRSRVRRSLLAL